MPSAIDIGTLIVCTPGICEAAQLILVAKQQISYTFNVGDFCQLHALDMAEGQTHAGIVVSSQRVFSG